VRRKFLHRVRVRRKSRSHHRGRQPETRAAERGDRGIDCSGSSLQKHLHRDQPGRIRADGKSRVIQLAGRRQVPAGQGDLRQVGGRAAKIGKARDGGRPRVDFRNEPAARIATKDQTQAGGARDADEINRAKVIRVPRLEGVGPEKNVVCAIEDDKAVDTRALEARKGAGRGGKCERGQQLSEAGARGHSRVQIISSGAIERCRADNRVRNPGCWDEHASAAECDHVARAARSPAAPLEVGSKDQRRLRAR